MSQERDNSQRFTAYRACIPFYILYDLDLNANHLRLYGQIEQMESNPDPRVNATFSYSWMAEQLGINKRNARKMAKLLIDKGYVEHREIKPGVYIWNTKKAEVIVEDDSEGGSPRDPRGGLPETLGGVSQRPTKIPKDKIPKDKQPPISPKGVKGKNKIPSLSLNDMAENNPHDLPVELLTEWMAYRNKPVTERVWKNTNNVLSQLNELGISPLEAFEYLLDKQWQGIELGYFQNKIDQLKKTKDAPKAKENSERIARERFEAQEQQAKQRLYQQEAKTYRAIAQVASSNRPNLSSIVSQAKGWQGTRR